MPGLVAHEAEERGESLRQVACRGGNAAARKVVIMATAVATDQDGALDVVFCIPG